MRCGPVLGPGGPGVIPKVDWGGPAIELFYGPAQSRGDGAHCRRGWVGFGVTGLVLDVYGGQLGIRDAMISSSSGPS